MERKIHLQVCSGTTCFVMGGSDLLTIFDHISLEERERVTNIITKAIETRPSLPDYLSL